MLSFIEKLAVGNALRVFVQPPTGAVRWRVLRASSPNIPSFDFEGATVVLDDRQDRCALDQGAALINGTPVWYRPFYLMADGTWQAAAAKSGTPATTFQVWTSDAMDLVRNRLDLAFRAYVARGDFPLGTGRAVPVLTAAPTADLTQFPVISVHLGGDAPGERGIGEDFGGDEVEEDGLNETYGWLSRVSLTLMCWTLNADQRKLMRKLLKGALMANLSVFDNEGLVQIDMSFSDQDDFDSYGAPVYQVVGTFSCLAPSSVAALVPVVADVQITYQGR